MGCTPSLPQLRSKLGSLPPLQYYGTLCRTTRLTIRTTDNKVDNKDYKYDKNISALGLDRDL